MFHETSLGAYPRNCVDGSYCNLLYELLQLPHRLLDRDVRARAMYIVEVDRVDAKALQAGLGTLPRIFWRGVDGDIAVRVPLEAKFGGQEDIAASLGVELQPFPDKILAVSVGISGVPVGASELPGTVQDLESLLVRASMINRNISTAERFPVYGFGPEIVRSTYSAAP